MNSIPKGPITRQEEEAFLRLRNQLEADARARRAETERLNEVGLKLLQQRSERLGLPVKSASPVEGRGVVGQELESRVKPFTLRPNISLQDIYGLKADTDQEISDEVAPEAIAKIHDSLKYLFLPENLRKIPLPQESRSAFDFRIWPLSKDLMGERPVVPPPGDRHASVLTGLNAALINLHPDLKDGDNAFNGRFTIGKVMLSPVLAPFPGGIARNGWRLAAFGATGISDENFEKYPHRIYLLVYCGQSMEPYPKSTIFYEKETVDIDSNRAILGIGTHDNPAHPIDIFVVSRDSSSEHVFRPNGGLRIELVDQVENPGLMSETLQILNSITQLKDRLTDPTRRRMLVKGLGAGIAHPFSAPNKVQENPNT